MPTKRYKLNFEITATKRNMQLILSILAKYDLNKPNGFVDIKVYKDGKEPIPLKSENDILYFTDKMLDIDSTYVKIKEGRT